MLRVREMSDERWSRQPQPTESSNAEPIHSFIIIYEGIQVITIIYIVRLNHPLFSGSGVVFRYGVKTVIPTYDGCCTTCIIVNEFWVKVSGGLVSERKGRKGRDVFAP